MNRVVLSKANARLTLTEDEHDIDLLVESRHQPAAITLKLDRADLAALHLFIQALEVDPMKDLVTPGGDTDPEGGD